MMYLLKRRQQEQHVRGVKSLDAAELFLQQGHNLYIIVGTRLYLSSPLLVRYNSKDYGEAIEAFKKGELLSLVLKSCLMIEMLASSWYFRKGERSKSENAKAWVRRV